MISIIICSRTSELSSNIYSNIKNTIGCEYEFIIIDNSKNEYNIFSAYNEGVKRSKGEVLCFMHEDIIFHTNNWGNVVLESIKNNSIGVVGVIGSQFLPNKMASWWLCNSTKGQILQGYTNQKGNYSCSLDGMPIQDVTDVVVVDGLWFCISKELFTLIEFDENTFNSFHCYDVDICMQVLEQDKRVVIVPNILIEHCSLGNVRTSYYNELKKFYNKWNKNLPICSGINISDKDAMWVSEILGNYQKVVCRNIVLENSKAYNIGKLLLAPYKKIKH